MGARSGQKGWAKGRGWGSVNRVYRISTTVSITLGTVFSALSCTPPPNTIHSTSGTWKKSMGFTSGPPDVNALSQKTAVLSLDHMSSPVSRE